MSDIATLDRRIGLGTAALRVGVGAALLGFGRRLRGLAGGDPDDPVLRSTFRYFGVRDVALGVATLGVTAAGGSVPLMVTLQGVADTTDSGVVAALWRRGDVRGWRAAGMVALAVGTAAGEYAGAWWLSRRDG